MLLKLINCVYIMSAIIFLIGNNAASKKKLKKSSDLETRIVGGTPALVENYPGTVKFYNFGALCSGTIINSWVVLTAAHCFDYNKVVDDMMIEVGTRELYDDNADLYDVLDFVTHEEYNITVPFSCDVALIFVTKAIKLGTKSKKIPLANTNKWMNINETNIVVAGWGWTKYGSDVSKQGLLQTHLRYVNLETCEHLHQVSFTPDMFCLYGDGARDTCKGDSGGGVLWNGMIVGIVSHGDGCAKKGKPSVYSNVWFLRGWIESHVEHLIKNYCEALFQYHVKIK